jgi:glycosyltransferase involved in cell wall biosynthesis
VTATRPELSVIVPVYRNKDSLRELYARISSALTGFCSFEVVLVDDACPEGSGELIDELAGADAGVVPLHFPTNRGQHRAVLEGLATARGSWCMIMDADLQDRPEEIPALLRRALAGDVDAVFAGRTGRYESRSRTLAARGYRRLLSQLLPLPSDAGLCVLVSRSVAARVLALRGPTPSVVAMIGCTGARMVSVPVARVPRSAGSTAYSESMRMQSALRALRWAIRYRARRTLDLAGRHRRRSKLREAP